MPEALAALHPLHIGQRGRPRDYSDVTIETDHLLHLAFGRVMRQTEGLLRPLTSMLVMDVDTSLQTWRKPRRVRVALKSSVTGVLTRGFGRTILNITATSSRAVTWERATDTVQFDWPEIEQTASRGRVNRAMAKMLIAARAAGATSVLPP